MVRFQTDGAKGSARSSRRWRQVTAPHCAWDIAEVWRRGSVIGAWLLDLTGGALLRDPQLQAYGGRVSDSGEDRWTLQAVIDEAVLAHLLSAALNQRFASWGDAGCAIQVLSALRQGFGDHAEKPTADST